MEYHFDLAGLHTLLCTPEAITVSDRLQPFLCETDTPPECVIRVQSRDILPEPSLEGIWHGAEYYDRQGDALRVFHCAAQGAEAFAVAQIFDGKEVEIAVLPDYLSYFSGSSGIFNRIGMETLLLQQRGLLLHASLIEFAGRGIAFAGPSGVGKSTQAGLWQKHQSARILNGDRAILRQTDAGWMAYGSPYAGTSGIYCRAAAPLRAIVVLKQAKENDLRQLSPAEALGSLFPELSIRRWDKSLTRQATDLCIALLAETPVYLLSCVDDESAVLLLKKGLEL